MTEYAQQPPQQGTPMTTIMEVTDYLDGQLAVDRLSDAGFPVEGVKIVGHDMKSVEIVTGRMTTGKAPESGHSAVFGLAYLLDCCSQSSPLQDGSRLS